MKKLLAMLLCSAMALATIGCGGISGGAAAGSKPEADSTAAVESEAAAESTAAVESEPAEEAEPAADGGVLMMATTTSTEDTGLLDYLQPLFKEATGIDLQWTAVGTGEALKLGEDGQVDIVLVHAKASEEEFVANGFGVERFPVMYNDFVIVGPAEPIAKTDDVAAVFGDDVVSPDYYKGEGNDQKADRNHSGCGHEVSKIYAFHGALTLSLQTCSPRPRRFSGSTSH